MKTQKIPAKKTLNLTITEKDIEVIKEICSHSIQLNSDNDTFVEFIILWKRNLIKKLQPFLTQKIQPNGKTNKKDSR